METLLRTLNVYIKKGDNLDEDAFLVDIMHLVGKYVRSTFKDKGFRVPLFFGDSAGAGLRAEDILERLVEHRLMVQCCLAPDGLTWKELVAPLLDGAQYGDDVVSMDRLYPIQYMPKVSRAAKRLRVNVSEAELMARKVVHPVDLPRLAAGMQSGRIYRLRGSRSGSADNLFRQPRFLLEFQQTCWIKEGVAFADLVDEVQKSVKHGDVVLLLIALTLSPELQMWVGRGVLTLKPGVCSPGAGNSLLYRAAGEKQWTMQSAQAPGQSRSLMWRKG